MTSAFPASARSIEVPPASQSDSAWPVAPWNVPVRPVRRWVVFPLLVSIVEAAGRMAAVPVVALTHEPALILYWRVKFWLSVVVPEAAWMPTRSRNTESRATWPPGPTWIGVFWAASQA